MKGIRIFVLFTAVILVCKVGMPIVYADSNSNEELIRRTQRNSMSEIMSHMYEYMGHIMEQTANPQSQNNFFAETRREKAETRNETIAHMMQLLEKGLIAQWQYDLIVSSIENAEITLVTSEIDRNTGSFEDSQRQRDSMAEIMSHMYEYMELSGIGRSDTQRQNDLMATIMSGMLVMTAEKQGEAIEIIDLLLENGFIAQWQHDLIVSSIENALRYSE